MYVRNRIAQIMIRFFLFLWIEFICFLGTLRKEEEWNMWKSD